MEMEAENVTISDSESTTGSYGDSNAVVVNAAAPSTRLRCSDCSQNFSSEQELLEHQNDTNQVSNITRVLMSALGRNPQSQPSRSPPTPPAPSPPRTFHSTTRLAPTRLAPAPHSLHAIGFFQRYQPYTRQREHQFIAVFPRDDDYVRDPSGRTMDLLSLIDRPAGSVPRLLPGPSGNGANQAIGSEAVDLDLKL